MFNSQDNCVSSILRAVKRSTDAGATFCSICADKATGKHYGAASCEGCKGFFRRSVRENKKYLCRFKQNCIINKEDRIKCKRCRFAKCFVVGMKKEAVQEERDKISQKSLEEKSTFPGILTSLITAEAILQKESFQINFDFSNMANASLADVSESIKNQILKLDEWSKYISAFSKLLHNDRVALLRAHAGDQLLLELANRSLNLNDMLLLANNKVLFRTNSVADNSNATAEIDINQISARVMDELVRPFNEIHLDENEFVAIKAIVFFDPNAKHLVNKEQVKSIRRQISNDLEKYVMNHHGASEGRLGELLLTLPSLNSISEQLIGQIHYANMFGFHQIDDIIKNVLLGGIQYPTISDTLYV